MTRLCCVYAQELGLDLKPIFARTGLTENDLKDESIRLRVATQIECLNLLAAALPDRLLGFHVAQQMDLRRTGFLYYVAASADILGDAMRGISRCSAMLNEGVEVKTQIGPMLRLGIDYAGISRLSDRHQIEAWTTAIVRCCRQITARELQPAAVCIMHPRIDESGEMDTFFGSAVQFGADKDEITFPGDVAKLPVVNADRYLNRLIVGFFDSALARRKRRSRAVGAEVENAIAALLPHGPPRLEDVARKLRVSPRTLRRRLAAENITFARILDKARFALARQYLAERDLSISRIAWLLGYAEVSAFSHAFRRWTGRAPRAARSRRPAARSTRTRRQARR